MGSDELDFDEDAFVAKGDAASGEFIWAKQEGETGMAATQMGSGLCFNDTQTALYMVGKYMSYMGSPKLSDGTLAINPVVNLEPNYSFYNTTIIICYDLNGNILSKKRVYPDINVLSTGITHTANSFYITGFFHGAKDKPKLVYFEKDFNTEVVNVKLNTFLTTPDDHDRPGGFLAKYRE